MPYGVVYGVKQPTVSLNVQVHVLNRKVKKKVSTVV